MIKKRFRGDRQGHSNEYDVGYGKPPIASRFKPGQSGNKKGRPTEVALTLQDIEEKLLSETRTVRSGDKVMKMPTYEVLIHKQIELALKGDTRALKYLISRTGKQNDRLSRMPLSIKQMTDKELEVLKQRLIENARRQQSGSSE